MNNKKISIDLLRITSIISVIILTLSCSKKDNNNLPLNGSVKVLVRSDISNLSQGENIAKLGQNPHSSGSLSEIISLNGDYFLQAELTTTQSLGNENPKGIIKRSSLNRAATTSSSLDTDIWYRVVVFNKNGGDYVTERIYKRGKESDVTITPALMLDGGVDYTFVAYSVNSTDINDLPDLSGPTTGKTIANCNVTVNNAGADLLFFKQDLFLGHESTENLDIIFKHQFSQLTLSINASATGYNVNEANISFLSKTPQVLLNFSNGAITRSGTNSSLSVSFPSLAAGTVTANPAVLNTANLNATERLVIINSLKIGDITVEDQSLFPNVTLDPGTKYNVNLSIVPNDKYLPDYGGYGIDAVRINGLVWMRHNLRADGVYSTSPDVPSSDIFGNYYQWGRKIPPFSPTYAGTTAPPGWTGEQYNVPYAWNDNAEQGFLENQANVRDLAPVKNITNDPCPDGYRVPTKNELTNLAGAVNPTTFTGGGTEGADQFTSAQVLTSKRNASVKMTIPAQGFFSASWNGTPIYLWSPDGVRNRGTLSAIWSSYFMSSGPSTGVRTAYFRSTESAAPEVILRNGNGVNTVAAYPIRCVAEDSTK